MRPLYPYCFSPGFTKLFLCLALLGLLPAAQAQVDPYQTVEAEDYDLQFGTRPGAFAGAVGFIQNGDYLGFRNVAFGDEGLFNGIVRASSNTDGGTIEFRLGSIVGPVLATADIGNTGGWTNFENFEIELSFDYEFGNATVPPTADLFLIFVGDGGFLFDVDNFAFSDTEVSATELTIVNCPTEPILVGEVYDFDIELLPVNTTNKFVAFYASDGLSVDYISGEFLTQTPGTYTVSTTSFSDGSVSDACTFEVTDGGQAAFNGPHTIPGTIEAEFYDVGGPGVAYRDDNIKQGNESFRPDDFVDVGSKSNASNGLAVGWIEDGEFLEYTLDEVDNGRYDITLTYSSNNPNPGDVELEIDRDPRVRFNDLAPTGGWNTFATTTVEGVFIPRGSVLRLTWLGSGFDIDKIAFVPTPSASALAMRNTTSPASDVGALDVEVYPNPSSDGRFTIALGEARLLRVYDARGREVLSRRFGAGRSVLDMGDVAPGVYVVRYGGGSLRVVVR